jgi:hypothetical protein
VKFDYAICNDGLVQAFTTVHVLLQSEYFSLCEMTREGAHGTWEVSARAAIRLRSRRQMPPQENGAVLRTALRRGRHLTKGGEAQGGRGRCAKRKAGHTIRHVYRSASVGSIQNELLVSLRSLNQCQNVEGVLAFIVDFVHEFSYE